MSFVIVDFFLDVLSVGCSLFFLFFIFRLWFGFDFWLGVERLVERSWSWMSFGHPASAIA